MTVTRPTPPVETTAAEGAAPCRDRLLGAVLAGGGSVRFGSDKALAAVGGRTLLDSAVAVLSGLCAEVVVVGREGGVVPGVPDRPGPGLGPLGGICGALHHAAGRGLAAVVTLPVDSLGFDGDALSALLPGPACAVQQPVVGVWPVSVLPVVEAILGGTGRHSLRELAEACGARMVELPRPLGNFNSPAELAAWEQAHG